LCIAGIVPKCVRSDWSSDCAAGAVDIDWGPGGYRDPARAKDVLVAVVRRHVPAADEQAMTDKGRVHSQHHTRADRDVAHGEKQRPGNDPNDR